MANHCTTFIYQHIYIYITGTCNQCANKTLWTSAFSSWLCEPAVRWNLQTFPANIAQMEDAGSCSGHRDRQRCICDTQKHFSEERVMWRRASVSAPGVVQSLIRWSNHHHPFWWGHPWPSPLCQQWLAVRSAEESCFHFCWGLFINLEIRLSCVSVLDTISYFVCVSHLQPVDMTTWLELKP